jgi:hypothetical protein
VPRKKRATSEIERRRNQSVCEDDMASSLTPSGETPDSIFRPDVSFFAVDPPYHTYVGYITCLSTTLRVCTYLPIPGATRQRTCHLQRTVRTPSTPPTGTINTSCESGMAMSSCGTTTRVRQKKWERATRSHLVQRRCSVGTTIPVPTRATTLTNNTHIPVSQPPGAPCSWNGRCLSLEIVGPPRGIDRHRKNVRSRGGSCGEGGCLLFQPELPQRAIPKCVEIRIPSQELPQQLKVVVA